MNFGALRATLADSIDDDDNAQRRVTKRVLWRDGDGTACAHFEHVSEHITKLITFFGIRSSLWYGKNVFGPGNVRDIVVRYGDAVRVDNVSGYSRPLPARLAQYAQQH